jgi:hypothetical protein
MVFCRGGGTTFRQSKTPFGATQESNEEVEVITNDSLDKIPADVRDAYLRSKRRWAGQDRPSPPMLTEPR